MNTAYLIGFIMGACAHLSGVALGWYLRGRIEVHAATTSTSGEDGSDWP